MIFSLATIFSVFVAFFKDANYFRLLSSHAIMRYLTMITNFCTHFFLSVFLQIFCREFRERRKQNVIKNGGNYRSKKARRVRTQHTFYPCPPPTASELDNYDESDSDDEFIDYNAVRISMCIFNQFF